MSRAFVNEDRLAEHVELPERELSSHTNYVTPRGMTLLKQRLAELQNERSHLLQQDEMAANERLGVVERDLRYYSARVESAKLVPPPAFAPERVTFGCRVTVETSEAEQMTYTLVGEDEADAESGLVSWTSPLGNALLGARVGDSVLWQRPAGEVELEVIDIQVPEQH
jgi:transcription elongation GreA/GreB family factor